MNASSKSSLNPPQATLSPTNNLPNEEERDIKARTIEMYSKFPIQLHVTKQDFLACPDDKTMWRLLCGRLDYLRVHLLLERLSTERGGASKRELFAVAQEMLDLTVFLWVQRDRSAGRVHHYDYMVYLHLTIFKGE